QLRGDGVGLRQIDSPPARRTNHMAKRFSIRRSGISQVRAAITKIAWAIHEERGWSLGSIVTIQSGFPLTPQLSYNPSNNGDTRNPVRPFLNPDFHGPLVLGKASQWFNPDAFLAPADKSGFWGNAGRGIIPGPGLGTWDFSVMKDTTITERLRLQFRAEFF